jgi:transcription antitermination protein NusB
MITPAPTPAARHKARHYAMQGLYQWQLSKLDPKEIVRQFQDEYDMAHVDVSYFAELLKAVPNQADALNAAFEPYLQDRSLAELDPITLTLLRIACYELMHRIDVPYRVVINEAVSLAKKFGPAESHKFINGVLDKAAGTYRAVEATGR